MWSVRRVAMVSVLLVGSLGGCADDERGTTVTVLAASSLTDVFEELAADFESANPDVDVRLGFGGSSSLVAQVSEGAPADVLATADWQTMGRVPAESLVGVVEVFATNSMVIAVETGNPVGIRTLADLQQAPVVVLADEQVPAGAYARQILECAGVELAVQSFEPSVRSAASKVGLGEADAAIVYRTDIGEGLDAVELDPACNVTAEYPLVRLSASDEAADFVEFVTGPDGMAVLSAAGFEAP